MTRRLLVLVPSLGADPRTVGAAAESAGARLRAAGFETVAFTLCELVDRGGMAAGLFADITDRARADADGLALVGGGAPFGRVCALRDELNTVVPCRTVAGWLTWARAKDYMARLMHPAGTGAGL